MAQQRRPVALVTGARRGIGRAIAVALARRGLDLVVNDVTEDDEAGATLEQLREAGARATFLRHDVADIAGHAAFVAKAWAAFGELDCLVNNAGVQLRRRADMLEDTPEEFDRLMGVNLRGPYFLTIAVARRMIAAAEGAGVTVHRSIVNVASANSFMVSPMRGPYCLSKSAVTMMTGLFAARLAAHGIAVNEVRPGIIETDMTAGVRDQYSARIAAGVSPMARWGQPADVASAVAALASGALPFMTGDSLHVDGGLHLPRL